MIKLIQAIGSLALAALFFTAFSGALVAVTISALENHKVYEGAYYAK